MYALVNVYLKKKIPFKIKLKRQEQMEAAHITLSVVADRLSGLAGRAVQPMVPAGRVG